MHGCPTSFRSAIAYQFRSAGRTRQHDASKPAQVTRLKSHGHILCLIDGHWPYYFFLNRVHKISLHLFLHSWVSPDMEYLGLVSSMVFVIEATAKLCQQLEIFKQAPEVYKQLVEEVREVSSVLQALGTRCARTGPIEWVSTPPCSHGGRLMQRI
jgi:hypothetical protein